MVQICDACGKEAPPSVIVQNVHGWALYLLRGVEGLQFLCGECGPQAKANPRKVWRETEEGRVAPAKAGWFTLPVKKQ